MASGTIRKSYDGIVACVPVTIPYRRYSTNSAHWWIGRALHELVKRAGLRPRDHRRLRGVELHGRPGHRVGLTQHFGLSPRWLDHIPFGGASGIVALRRAARAVQAGDAEIVACVGGDTNHVDSFRKTLSTFSRFAQDAVYPYGSGGANASFALITKNYMNSYGAKREDFGKLCIAQRDNALSIPYAHDEEEAHARRIHGGAADRRSDPSVRLRDAVRRRRGISGLPRGHGEIARAARRAHPLDHRAPQRLPERSDAGRAAAGRWMSTSSGRWRGSSRTTSISSRPMTTIRSSS